MTLSRRSILAGASTAIAAAVAGCGGGGDEEPENGDGSPETTAEQTPTEESTPSAQTVADEELHLEPGHHDSFRVYHDTRFRLSYEFEVTSGPDIDVFVVTHQQLSRYESERLFDTVAGIMDAGSGSEEVELSNGTYHLVVDHTSAGEASPQSGINQEAVDVQVSATSEPL